MSLATKRCRKTNTISVPHAKASVAHSEMRHAALCITGLAVFEDIPYSSQRANQRLLLLAVPLPAQPVDMHVNHVRIRLDAHAPYLVQNHGSGHHPSGVPAQVLQQNKLLRSQLQHLARARSFPSQQIQLQVEHSEPRCVITRSEEHTSEL